ncbi:MAG TPA: CcmD family protein [Ktedonobacteraceae bacterium]|jgi:CcmD family protein|nr:CcmD family protein [Ktedonobacteraceae bacterium]
MQENSYLIIAYAVAWVALFVYLAFLLTRIRGVRMELAAVEELVREHEEAQTSLPYSQESES